MPVTVSTTRNIFALQVVEAEWVSNIQPANGFSTSNILAYYSCYYKQYLYRFCLY